MRTRKIPNNIVYDLGLNGQLRSLRQLKKLTQREVADILKLPYWRYHKMETGGEVIPEWVFKELHTLPIK